MPIYITKCTNEQCGYVQEVIIPLTSELPDCKECGSKTEKIPAVSNSHFKGSGWTPKNKFS